MSQFLSRTILVFSAPAKNKFGESTYAELNLEQIRYKVQAIGYNMVWANPENTGPEYAIFSPPAAIIINHAPDSGCDALALSCQLRKSVITAQIPIIIYSSIREVSVMNLAYQLGASYYLTLEPAWGHKSYEPVNELCEVTFRLIDSRNLQRKLSKTSPTHCRNVEFIGMGLAPSHLNN